MSARWAGVGVLLAVAAAGLAFAPVFGVGPVLVLVLAVVLPVGLADALLTPRPRLAPWRPLLAAGAGAAVGVAVLCLPGAPWAGTLPDVLEGALHGWRRTLESTFPARPDAALVAFVPLLCLVAGLLGIEWLRRGVAPLVTLLPGLAVLGIAQVFRAPGLVLGLGLGLVWALGAGLVLSAGRRRALQGTREVAVLAVPLVVVAVLVAGALVTVDPRGSAPATVHDRFEVSGVPAGSVSPLSEVGGRLDDPDEVVLTARSQARVDRWPLMVLDGFDGAGWTSSARYRPLGTALDADTRFPSATTTSSADVQLGRVVDGPWLPTQFRTVSVDGARPSVDPSSGTLLLPGGTRSPYTITWREQATAVAPEAGFDRGAPGAVAPPEVPAAVAAAARRAVPDPTSSFATATRLETWLRENYTVATGGRLPTGSGSAQIVEFLDGSKRGTSEQFAAAYVLMARALGIPARLVVGFSQPPRLPDGTYVVHNRDALAWPEVAVLGVGWIPLDPAGGDRRNDQDTQRPGGGSSSGAAPQAAPQQSSAGPRGRPSDVVGSGGGLSVWSLLGALVLAAAVWLGGVPGWKSVRRARRRRQIPRLAVVGAWLDVRDELRDHGVAVGRDMTVRDAGGATTLVAPVASDVEELARAVDAALWSGVEPSGELAERAWSSSASIRRELARRPWTERLRAAVRLTSLRRSR